MVLRDSVRWANAGLRACFVVLALQMSAGVAWAQASGGIAGVVRDASGAVLAG